MDIARTLPGCFRVRRPAVALSAAFLLLLLPTCKSKTEQQGEVVAPPRDALELVFTYGSEKEKWISEVTNDFKRADHYVFVDEADQAIGRREFGSGDSGISRRIYSMLAEEMGSSTSRGNLIWILASSRPDLIEVDLKRPGRIDVKIPLFPTTSPRESFDLIRTLCKKRDVRIEDTDFASLESLVPVLLTPGAAEALAVKVYRLVRTSGSAALDALRICLTDYQNPVPLETLEFQIRLAVNEASDLEFLPTVFRTVKPLAR